MDLSPEDSLRLHVLFSQQLRAVRIDESRLVVHALTARGEARVPLNANTREDRYLRAVREVLAMHALGVPAGYPVHLHRWTRSAQGRSEDQLRRLLLLGEPEAVVAVAGAPELSDELAELAWWASATVENARQMLASAAVAGGRMGPVLARFVFEFLPFEEDHRAIAESVALILAPGLLTEAERQALWARGRTKVAYQLGFLRRTGEALPATRTDHAALAAQRPVLEALAAAGNPHGQALLAALSAPGQTLLHAVRQALTRISGKDVAAGLAQALGDHVRYWRGDGYTRVSVPWGLTDEVGSLDDGTLDSGQDAALREALAVLPDARERFLALAAWAELDETAVVARLGSAEPVGSALRGRLKPWLVTLEAQLAGLLSAP